MNLKLFPKKIKFYPTEDGTTRPTLGDKKLKNFHKIRKITLYLKLFLKIRKMNNIFSKKNKIPPYIRWRGIGQTTLY